MKNEDNFVFKSLDKVITSQEDIKEEDKVDAILIVPSHADSISSGRIEILTYTKLGMLTKNKLEAKLQNIIETQRFERIDIDAKKIEEIKSPVKPVYKSISGEKKMN